MLGHLKMVGFHVGIIRLRIVRHIFEAEQALAVGRFHGDDSWTPAAEAEFLKDTVSQAGFLQLWKAVIEDSMIDDDVVVTRTRHLLLVVGDVLLGGQLLASWLLPPSVHKQIMSLLRSTAEAQCSECQHL